MRVSIIIPCYNSEKYINHCIDSIIGQTYEEVEIIAVDNESTDNTYAILKEYEAKSGIKISTTKNIYQYCWDEPRQEGLKLSTGDYIMVMGSDDMLDIKFVENYMNIFSLRPEQIKLLQSPIRGIDENNRYVVTQDICHKYNTLEEFKKIAVKKCPVNTPTVMFSRELLDKNLMETDPGSYSGAADYHLWCQLANEGYLIYSPPVWQGFYYRWHDDQATWGMNRDKPHCATQIRSLWRDKWKI